MLDKDEKLEQLGYNNLQVVQNQKLYKFTTDAVLLANFAKVKKGSTIVELGTGSGVVALLVASRCKPKKLIALEIQDCLLDMAKKSVLHNKLENIIDVVKGDISTAYEQLGVGFADAVIINPPYRKIASGQRQDSDHLSICRHEVLVTLEQIVFTSGKLLNCNGSLYMVHQAERMAEIISLCDKNKLQLKEFTAVSPKKGEKPNLVLMRFVKDGKVGVKWNLINIFSDDGKYIPQWEDKKDK